VLRAKRRAAIACVAGILLAFCLAGQAAADVSPVVQESAGGGALASVRLVLAVLLATTVAGLIVVGLFSRTGPR